MPHIGFLVLAWAATPSAASCPVTLAATQAFAEPSPSSASRFWYGSEELAVLLSTGGSWQGMGPTRRYRDKLVWWRQGYHGPTETRPALKVTGRRVDGPAPAIEVTRVTNAHHADFGGWAMMMAMEFPAPGCWEITGAYRDHELAFVVRVGP